MNRMPSVAPWPVVPIIVTAESCVAMTESPTAHHGSERLARKYPSISLVPFARRMPSHAMYEIQPTTMSQLIGCIRLSAREGDLQPPQQQLRDHLHGHHLHEGAPEAFGQTFALRLVVCGSVNTSF